MLGIAAVVEAADIVEDRRPANHLDIHRVALSHRPFRQPIGPHEHSSDMADAVDAIWVVSKPARRRLIRVEDHSAFYAAFSLKLNRPVRRMSREELPTSTSNSPGSAIHPFTAGS